LKRSRILLIITAAIVLSAPSVFAVDRFDVTGFWIITDEFSAAKTRRVMAVYEYDGLMYGRLICEIDKSGLILDDIYQQKNRMSRLVGKPPVMGLDIVYSLEKKDDEYGGGKVMNASDPQKKPNIYDCEIWRDGDVLKLRGKLLFIGGTRSWDRFDSTDFPDGFAVPDYRSFTPTVPSVAE